MYCCVSFLVAVFVVWCACGWIAWRACRDAPIARHGDDPDVPWYY